MNSRHGQTAVARSGLLAAEVRAVRDAAEVQHAAPGEALIVAGVICFATVEPRLVADPPRTIRERIAVVAIAEVSAGRQARLVDETLNAAGLEAFGLSHTLIDTAVSAFAPASVLVTERGAPRGIHALARVRARLAAGRRNYGYQDFPESSHRGGGYAQTRCRRKPGMPCERPKTQMSAAQDALVARPVFVPVLEKPRSRSRGLVSTDTTWVA